jgi:hypothetical protein
MGRSVMIHTMESVFAIILVNANEREWNAVRRRERMLVLGDGIYRGKRVPGAM